MLATSTVALNSGLGALHTFHTLPFPLSLYQLSKKSQPFNAVNRLADIHPPRLKKRGFAAVVDV